jgi:hypothetical protein
MHRIIFIAVTIMNLACEKSRIEDDQINGNISIDKELIQELNADAYDTLFLESGTFILDAYIWRDFQPISPPNGKPMFSINWLINIDSVKIPDNIDLIKQFVINTDSIWISDYLNDVRPNQPIYKIEKYSNGGPKWGPGINVDVVAQIYDSLYDKIYYLKCKNVYVSRTD